jgi:hypothetical protein
MKIMKIPTDGRNWHDSWALSARGAGGWWKGFRASRSLYILERVGRRGRVLTRNFAGKGLEGRGSERERASEEEGLSEREREGASEGEGESKGA